MRFKLGHVNLLLFLAIGAVALGYWSELRWAAGALPAYVEGRIKSPTERRLYVEARGMIDGNDWEQARAREMLDRSLAIDPYGEAGFWLAELLREVGRETEAIEQYRAYLSIDPTRPDAYLKLAALLERSGRPDEAVGVLERGRDYFVANADRYRPVLDDDAAPRFNRKALEVYETYRLAGGMLQREIDWIEAKADPKTRRGR